MSSTVHDHKVFAESSSSQTPSTRCHQSLKTVRNSYFWGLELILYQYEKTLMQTEQFEVTVSCEQLQTVMILYREFDTGIV